MYLPTFALPTGETSCNRLYDALCSLVCVSLTLGWSDVQDRDIDRSSLRMMSDYFEKFAVCGVASLERGKKLKNLHVQATFCIHARFHGYANDKCLAMLMIHLKYAC